MRYVWTDEVVEWHALEKNRAILIVLFILSFFYHFIIICFSIFIDVEIKSLDINKIDTPTARISNEKIPSNHNKRNDECARFLGVLISEQQKFLSTTHYIDHDVHAPITVPKPLTFKFSLGFDIQHQPLPSCYFTKTCY